MLYARVKDDELEKLEKGVKENVFIGINELYRKNKDFYFPSVEKVKKWFFKKGVLAILGRNCSFSQSQKSVLENLIYTEYKQYDWHKCIDGYIYPNGEKEYLRYWEKF